MLQLIKAEIAYKKWDYLCFLAMPFLLGSFVWLILGEQRREMTDGLFFVLYGFGASLLVVAIRMPFMTSRTNVEENRIHLLATLPVPLCVVAMSQSLPFLIHSFTLSLLGLVAALVANGGVADLPWLLVLNGSLLAMTLGTVIFFLRELLTLLPRWVNALAGIFLLSLVIPNPIITEAWQMVTGLLSIAHLAATRATVQLMAVGAFSFFGHILLFTHVRNDLSVRRVYK